MKKCPDCGSTDHTACPVATPTPGVEINKGEIIDNNTQQGDNGAGDAY